MKIVSEKKISPTGDIVREPRDMYSLLNYNILKLLDKTYRSGPLDFPEVYCNTDLFPDYLALYSQKSLYHKTPLTGVCFYSYDKEFDGKDGLFNAIYYNDAPRLSFFKKRFEGVKFFIAPDYSIFGDIHRIENYYRIWKSRIVMMWLQTELDAIVIPNIMYSLLNEMPVSFSGLSNCSVVAFSTKSHMQKAEEYDLTQQAIRYAVDSLPLKAIVIYTVCRNETTVLELFDYAVKHNIRLVIPNNTLLERNRALGGTD